MPHERTELDTPRLTLLAYTPEQLLALIEEPQAFEEIAALTPADGLRGFYVSGDVSPQWLEALRAAVGQDRKSTRLNSSHLGISYAVFCLKKKRSGRDAPCHSGKARPIGRGLSAQSISNPS